MMADLGKTLLDVYLMTKCLPEVLALNIVNLDVRIAEVHAVVAKNSAGKSILMKMPLAVHKALPQIM
jgi:putative multiple sugar transport system ATP-binding protein